MINTNYPSITQYQQFVELKDYRPATKSRYVRLVRILAEHFKCDPATLNENQLREYYVFLRQQKWHFHVSTWSFCRRWAEFDKSGPTRC